jgi:hypothetical protein
MDIQERLAFVGRAQFVIEQLSRIKERAEAGELSEDEASWIQGAWDGFNGVSLHRAGRIHFLLALDAARHRTAFNGMMRERAGQALTPEQRRALKHRKGFAYGMAKDMLETCIKNSAERGLRPTGELSDTLEERIGYVRAALLTALGLRITDEQIARALDAWTRSGRPAKGVAGPDKWPALSQLCFEVGLGKVDAESLRSDWKSWDFVRFRPGQAAQNLG